MISKKSSDFRKILYDRYVSTFKKHKLEEDKDVYHSRIISFRHRFLAFFDNLDRGARILELGSGPGYMLEMLQTEGFTNLNGIDISEEQIIIARNKGLNVEKIDAIKFLENQKETFEVIIAIDFLEHFYKDEIFNLLSLIHRSLSPGGILIIQTPNGQGLFARQVIYGDLTHCTIFTPGTIRQLLHLYKFSNIKCYNSSPIYRGLKGIIRRITWNFVTFLARFVKRMETGKRQVLWSENIICFAEKEKSIKFDIKNQDFTE